MVPQALPALLAQQVQEYLVQRVQRELVLRGPLVRPGQE